MVFKKIKKLRSFSVLIVPDDASHGTRSQKLTPERVIAILALYTIIVFILSGLIIRYTPLNDAFAPESNLSSGDIEKIENLNERIIFLAKELESLKSTNERLRYAVMLGDSTLLDSIEKSKEEKSSNPLKDAGGNLLGVIRELFGDDKKSGNSDSSSANEMVYYFSNPAAGFISRTFLPAKGHFGIDYVLKTGSPVYAAAGGYVIFADYTLKDGYMIIINHSNDYITVYKHCSVLVKKVREVTVQGELIALSGDTGETSIGPHLHFEIWKNGQPVNPKKLLLNN